MKKFKLKELLFILLMAASFVFASCSSDSSSDDGGSSDSVENPSSENPSPANPIAANEETKTGTVSIKIAIDDSDIVTYTVTFQDATEEGYTSQESVTAKVESGKKASAPSWTRDGYTLAWSSSVDGIEVGSKITADVTFTAVWTKIVYYTVTFKDSDGTNADDVQTIESGKTATVPSWTKENYTLAWTSSVEGISATDAITQDVTFTASWTEKPECSNCGTHYDTQAQAKACSVKEGCPNYGKVTTIALVGSDGNVISGNSNVTVTGSVNKKESNGAITIKYEGTEYKTVKLDSDASIVVKAAKGQKITVIGSLPAKKQNCFKVGETSYKLDSKTTALTTFEKSFESTGEDTIKKGDTASIALIIIQ